MNLIEQLEKLPRTHMYNHERQDGSDEAVCTYVKLSDLRAIIEQAKRESVDQSPQPDHTKLIGELVNALERAEKCLVNSCMSHRNKVYPKPVDRVRVANHCNRAITKAREAIK